MEARHLFYGQMIMHLFAVAILKAPSKFAAISLACLHRNCAKKGMKVCVDLSDQVVYFARCLTVSTFSINYVL